MHFIVNLLIFSQSRIFSVVCFRALLSSQEAPEDDPEQGMLSLKKVRNMVESMCEYCIVL